MILFLVIFYFDEVYLSYLGLVKLSVGIWIVCLLSLCSPLSAQIVENRFVKTRALTINDGLSQGMINSILQDKYGFMWFGTNDGLNRYDGYRFIVYRNDANDAHSISGNYITTVFEDSKGRLWIGTGLNGINIFNRETENFVHLTGISGYNLASSRVLNIQEDKYGSIWVATTNGLFKITFRNAGKIETGKDLEESQMILKHITFDAIVDSTEFFRFHDETTGIDYFEPTFFIDSKGMGWASTNNGCYNIITTENGQDKFVRPDTSIFIFPKDPMSRKDQYIFSYLEDTMNHKLYLMRRGYITIVDQLTGSVQRLECGKYHLGFYRSPMIFHEGKILGANSGHVYHFDFANNKIYSFFPKEVDHSRIMTHSNLVYKDRSGIVWIGSTGYGLVKINPRTEKFHEISLTSVLWLSSTSDNKVFAVLNSSLPSFVKKSTPRTYEIDTSLNSIFKTINSYSTDAVVQGKNGSYYINSSNIFHVTGDLEKAEIVSPIRGCFPLYIDKSDNLWFGSNTGFCRYDARQKNVKQYDYPLTSIMLSPYKFLEVIYEDGDDFWLGTVRGLLRFNTKTEKWKHYVNKPDDRNSLSADIIFSVCNDPAYPSKYLWIGTNGGGLNCLEKQNGNVTHFNEREGLPNAVVYGVVSDSKGRLWMSTNKGIACFTPEYSRSSAQITGGSFKNYEENDGLQSNEFNRYAFAKSTDGTMFFGGINGLNYFHPDEIKNNNYIPEILITGFRLSNTPIIYNSVNSVNSPRDNLLVKPVFLTKSISLPFDENMISFEFAAMDFTAGDKNAFRYKLENFDHHWVNSGNNNTATYTNLDPGKYIFTVVGSNNDGVWNPKGASIELIILPPWYLTWWFRLSLALVVAVSIYIVYRYRLKQALNLLQVRNSIASDLHDEIGSTLSSVYIYSEVAQKSSDTMAPEAQVMMKNISSEVASMIEALGDIVWTVNAKNDRFENIINRMHAVAVELFEAQNYNLHFEMDERLNTLKMRMEARRNFYLIFKEAINNIVKYAKGNNAWIQLKLDNRKISLSIKDDGVGFDVQAKREGNGLFNIVKRAAELKGSVIIISSSGNGTEIRLEFPYS